MADAYLLKVMKRARTLNRVSSQVGETIKVSTSGTEDLSHPNITAKWSVQRVEMIGVHKITEADRPVSWGQSSARDPQHRVWDYKVWAITFRVKGIIHKTTNWNDAADVRDYAILIFEDGGAYTFCWQNDTYTVNTVDYNFTNEKRESPTKINFTIDLRVADYGTGVT